VESSDIVCIVTCMIRQSAEDRVFSLIKRLSSQKQSGRKVKIIVTGCMSGMAYHDSSGKVLARLKRRFPDVDEFLPIDEVGFENPQIRTDSTHALVLISNGCNNFCTYCVVPYARGREISRPYENIIGECKELVQKGYTSITLVGQNVNSYGSDLVLASGDGSEFNIAGKKIRPVYVKHLGKMRIPTLFPFLLSDIAQIKGIQSVDFISSNPWDFSNELIDTISRYQVISRVLHLPVQSGDEKVLARMNRWYTPKEYMDLVDRIRKKIPDIIISTDIIVGFSGETDKEFKNTVALVGKVKFSKAYIAMYSVRTGTAAQKTMKDTVPYAIKKQRWEILDQLINKENLRLGTYPKTLK